MATGRRRLPGVNLKQGTVKQARAEAGMSLAQLGKGHVTAPAIYLIETGRTRPSLPTLEHIARRTGKPVEFFLADPDGAIDETQAGLVEHVTPFSDALRMPNAGMLSGMGLPNLAALEGVVTQQAAAMAYSNDFLLMTLVSLCAFPLLALIRSPKALAAAARQGNRV